MNDSLTVGGYLLLPTNPVTKGAELYSMPK